MYPERFSYIHLIAGAAESLLMTAAESGRPNVAHSGAHAPSRSQETTHASRPLLKNVALWLPHGFKTSRHSVTLARVP